MSFSGLLEDRQLIREFYGAFSYASSCQATEEWLSFWAEECTWITNHFTLTGKAAVRDQWGNLWQNFEKVGLLCEVGSIKVEGDHASTGVIVREIIKMKGGGLYKLIGRYEDNLIRQQGQWRFLRREYFVIAEEV